MTFRQKSSFEYCSYISLSFAQILSYITLVIALYPYTVTKRFQDWSFSTFGEDQEIVQITSNDWRAGIIPEDNVFGEAGGRRSLVVRGLSVILTLQPKFLDRVRTWTCRVCGAFAFAVDLTDSKGRISAYLLLVSLCDLRPSISSSFSGLTTVFGLFWIIFYRHLPVVLFAFLQIFDPDVLVLLLYIRDSSCFYVHNLYYFHY